MKKDFLRKGWRQKCTGHGGGWAVVAHSAAKRNEEPVYRTGRYYQQPQQKLNKAFLHTAPKKMIKTTTPSAYGIHLHKRGITLPHIYQNIFYSSACVYHPDLYLCPVCKRVQYCWCAYPAHRRC